MQRWRGHADSARSPRVDAAEAALSRATTLTPAAAALRARVFELAEALFQSIRMQLAVKPYGAIAVGRGANLDTIDVPLNNRAWLADRFAEIRALAEEAERLAAIDAILRWTDPGPGGFYDDLGDPSRQPHLVRGPGLPRILDRSSPRLPASATGPAGASPGWRTPSPSTMAASRCTTTDSILPPAIGCASSTPASLQLHAEAAPGCRWLDRGPRLDGQAGPSEACGVRRAGVGDLGRRVDAHLAAGARRGGAGRGNQVAEVWLCACRRERPGEDARGRRTVGTPVRRKLRNGELLPSPITKARRQEARRKDRIRQPCALGQRAASPSSQDSVKTAWLITVRRSDV